jgi:hypothetical protein
MDTLTFMKVSAWVISLAIGVGTAILVYFVVQAEEKMKEGSAQESGGLLGVTARLRPVQNLGLLDRIIRIVIGGGMFAIATVDLAIMKSAFDWHGYVMLAAVYPVLTAVLGWDPFYALIGTKSCSERGRGQCGTFPYEVNAALGRYGTPGRNCESDHSLTCVTQASEGKPKMT